MHHPPFTAMLIFIGFDLVLEWIWEVRLKLTTIEYLILLTTFATMCCTSLDIGIAVGLGLSVVAFVLSFASEVRGIYNLFNSTSSSAGAHRNFTNHIFYC